MCINENLDVPSQYLRVVPSILQCLLVLARPLLVVIPFTTREKVGNGKTPSNNGGAKWKLILKKEVSKRIGLLKWLPQYTKVDAISDLIAGITMGLTIVPQSMAYASLARLPPEIGLYSSFAGGFLYVLFGTIKQVSVGPTSLMSLLTLQYIGNLPHDYLFQYLFLLTFLCGVVELLMGVLGLGFLTEVISAPVISGFTSASAIIIIVSQVKHILGVSYKSDSFNDDVAKVFQNITKFKPGDTILGVLCIVFLLSLRKLKDCSSENKMIRKVSWFVSVGRNVVAVVVCAFVAYRIEKSGTTVPFVLTKRVHPGLPSLQLPPFEIVEGNRTVSFIELVSEFKSGIIVIPIVAVLINVSIAKTFATGGTVDATQEMLSLAFCNIFASCCSSMPICGAFTRSAVSNASGVRTPFANFYTGVIVILALTFLTPSFRYIPKATLAAVLISAVIFLIDLRLLVPLWKTSKRDFYILVATTLSCLYFGVEIGLLVGVVLNMTFLLYMWARPNITCEKCKNEYGEYLTVTPQLGLFYLGSEYLYSYLTKVAKKNAHFPVAVNCSYFTGVDYSAMKTLSIISQDFRSKNQKLVFFNANDSMVKLSENSECKDVQLCVSGRNLNQVLFCEAIDFRRSVTVPIIDTELKEVKIASAEAGNGESDVDRVAISPEHTLLLNENETKQTT